MELTLTAVLALFSLLAISVGIYYAAKALKFPYTVLLVGTGMLLAAALHIPGVEPVLGFVDDAHLTPDLLLFVFLPILIFESGYSINIRRMVDSAWTIGALAVVGLAIATAGIAATLTWLLNLAGFDVPFIVVLLFSSVISATDPVGVLALFKTLGAPKRLSIIFEGESLFNDGTAVAIFVVVLAVIDSGYNGASTIFAGLATFTLMVLLGAIFGLIVAGICGSAIRATRTNAIVSSTLLVISANLVFVLAELFNHQHLHIGPVMIHISPIIATTIAALFLGNYWRHYLMPKVDGYVHKVVEHLAFLINSLVFIMAGILLTHTAKELTDLAVPMILAVLTVVVWRAISVYAVTTPIRLAAGKDAMPASWQVLLSWGSLRGALALIIIMTLPDHLKVPGWTLDSTPKEFLLALTVATIIFSTFVKAPSMERLMKRFNLTEPTPLAQARTADLTVHYLHRERLGFARTRTTGEFAHNTCAQLDADLDNRLAAARSTRDNLATKYGDDVFTASTHLMAISIEEASLRGLFVNREVNDHTYRDLLGKLQLQSEKILTGCADDIDPRADHDHKDIFNDLTQALTRKTKPASAEVLSFQKHRAEYAMASDVLAVLDDMHGQDGQGLFLDRPFELVVDTFTGYRDEAARQMHTLLESQHPAIQAELDRLAKRVRHKQGQAAVDGLAAVGILASHSRRDFPDLPA